MKDQNLEIRTAVNVIRERTQWRSLVKTSPANLMEDRSKQSGHIVDDKIYVMPNT